MNSKMMAANLHEVGKLVYESIDVPTCEKDEVLLRVKSCGVCGSDVPRVFSKGTYHFPTVIGHEFSGIVEFDPQNTLAGKRAAVFPLLPCHNCEACKSKNYAACSNYDYYGSRRDGGMAEFIAVKRWNLVFLPNNVSYDEGAMCEPAAVARKAFRKSEVKAGDSLLVLGAGPIGIIIGQWARSVGVEKICYCDIDARKIEIAKSFGFEEYSEKVEITAAIEGTGTSSGLEKCLAAVKPFSKIVLMGNPAKEMVMTQNTYWHILRKELTLVGTWNSSYNDEINDWQEAVNAVSSGILNLKPLITHKFKLSECGTALEMMKNKSEVYNKVIINP